MLKRTITSIVGIAILIPVILFSNMVVLPIAVSVFSLIALIEMFKCIGVYNNVLLTLPFYILGLISPFSMRYVWHEPMEQSSAFLLALIIVTLYELTIMVFSKRKLNFCI